MMEQKHGLFKQLWDKTWLYLRVFKIGRQEIKYTKVKTGGQDDQGLIKDFAVQRPWFQVIEYFDYRDEMRNYGAMMTKPKW